MNWIKKVFGVNHKGHQKEDEYKLDSNEIYLHEDFYCQVELLPIENLNELNSENKKINKFTSEHFDGTGFTDIYERSKEKLKTQERKIDVKEFENLILILGFSKMKSVYSGYGNFREKCDNTNAYSINGATVFCDYKEKMIQNIWLDGFRFNQDSEYVNEMTEVLYQIGEKWKLTLNDWDLTENIDLRNRPQIEAYITEK